MFKKVNEDRTEVMLSPQHRTSQYIYPQVQAFISVSSHIASHTCTDVTNKSESTLEVDHMR